MIFLIHFQKNYILKQKAKLKTQVKKKFIIFINATTNFIKIIAFKRSAVNLKLQWRNWVTAKAKRQVTINNEAF